MDQENEIFTFHYNPSQISTEIFSMINIAKKKKTPGDRLSIKDAIVELKAAKARFIRIWVYIGDRR